MLDRLREGTEPERNLVRILGSHFGDRELVLQAGYLGPGGALYYLMCANSPIFFDIFRQNLY